LQLQRIVLVSNIYILVGLYLIITSWTIPNLPVWFSIVNTVLGAMEIMGSIIRIVLNNNK